MEGYAKRHSLEQHNICLTFLLLISLVLMVFRMLSFMFLTFSSLLDRDWAAQFMNAELTLLMCKCGCCQTSRCFCSIVSLNGAFRFLKDQEKLYFLLHSSLNCSRLAWVLQCWLDASISIFVMLSSYYISGSNVTFYDCIYLSLGRDTISEQMFEFSIFSFDLICQS